MDICKMVDEIAMQAIENQEEFIFETINPYCENVLQMKVNKEELKQILFNDVQKQQPCEDCVKREDVRNGMIKYGFLAPDMTVTEFVDNLLSVTPSYNSIKTELKPCEDCINREDAIKQCGVWNDKFTYSRLP